MSNALLQCLTGFLLIPVLSAVVLAQAAQPGQPEKIVLRVGAGRAITRGFLGFGVELDPMVLNANNRRRGVTDEDWTLITDRLAAMNMPIVRMMSQLSWFAKAGGDKLDYENQQVKSLLAYLDFCQKHDIDVILTDWAWVHECKWLKGHDDPAYAKGIAAYLKSLLDERKYSCIKFLVIGNEPDNEIKDIEKYGRMYHRVHEALKEAGLRDRIKLMGPDIAGQWEWFDKAAAGIADVVDAYDFHRYAERAEVRDDGQKVLLRNLTRFRPVVEKVDPNGKDKPILMTEMGMAGGGTNEHKLIDTFDYALHMGGYAIGVLNSGAKAGIAWCAFDVYYFDGEQFMTWGMWKYKNKGWELKPWHGVWQEVTKAVPRGADVLAVEGATATVHAAAIGTGHSAGEGSAAPTYSRFVLLLANRGPDEKVVSIQRPREAGGRWSKVCCLKGRVEKSEPAGLGAGNAPLEVSLPAESFTVVRVEFPVPTR
jgi:hypothetical protein